MSEIAWQVGYKTKTAPINAPAEATRVPTRLPNEKGAESAMAALVLVAEADADADEDAADVALEVAVEAGVVAVLLTTTIHNQSRECGKRDGITDRLHTRRSGAATRSVGRQQYSLPRDTLQQPVGMRTRCRRRAGQG